VAGRIAAAVARRIVEQEPGYEPGAFLIEADIAKSEGASRTPGREAMLQLERWGLVRMIPKKGAIVTLTGEKEIRDLLATRIMLEAESVRTFDSNGTDPDTLLAQDLADLLTRQRDSAAAQDLLTFAADDYRFHARIIQSGGNDVIMGLLENLGPRLARLTYQAVINNPHMATKYLAEHEQLAQLVAESDFSTYASLAHKHVFDAHFPLGSSN